MVSIPSANANGDVTVGDVLTTTKTYTPEELHEFRLLNGAGDGSPPDHLPYLLVVAPLTKLGGDIDYISARMDWTTSRPVRSTETLTAELEITRLEPVDNGVKIVFSARIRSGTEVVLSGQSKGIVLTH